MGLSVVVLGVLGLDNSRDGGTFKRPSGAQASPHAGHCCRQNLDVCYVF